MIRKRPSPYPDTAVLEIRGTLSGGTDYSPLLSAIDAVPASPDVAHVLLDMHELKWVNSSGLCLLLEARSHLASAGRDLALVAPARRVESVLMLTQLMTALPCYRTMSEAVRDLNGVGITVTPGEP